MTATSGAKVSPRPLVLLDAVTTTALPDRIATLEERGAVLELVDYSRLASATPRLRRVLDEHDLDFVLFARNDQVYDRRAIGSLIRALEVGYSSFSGIDSEFVLSQTRTCLDDYLAGRGRLELQPSGATEPTADGDGGTFSLLFDLEQLGGARFGLPRVLEVLHEFEAPATFFTTSFVGSVYIDVFDALAQYSHEIGLHGLYHEYLAGRELGDQLALIDAMKAACGDGVAVRGANFIGRMDDITVEAMVASGLEYFVMFMEHRYAPFRYRLMPVRPMRVATADGAIWMIPVSVETNNRPWRYVKRLVDAAVGAAEDDGFRHVNVLLHPFRDGALRHIGDLRRLIAYLRLTLGLAPARLGDVVAGLPSDSPDTLVHYPLGGNGAAGGHAPGRFARPWWFDRSRYDERVGAVYEALSAEGHRPALTVRSERGRGESSPTFAVYPHLPKGPAESHAVAIDPLEPRRRRLRDAVRGAMARDGRSSHAFVPAGLTSDVLTAVRASRPRRRADYSAFVPEAALRVAYRLTRGRHVF
jgi:peptidoglycan/xylan/chitin deacetylase (PgdA/CDA1 family)